MKILAFMSSMALVVLCSGFSSSLGGVRVISLVARYPDVYGAHGEGLIAASHEEGPFDVNKEQREKLERILQNAKRERGKFYGKYCVNVEYDGRSDVILVNGHSFVFNGITYRVNEDLGRPRSNFKCNNSERDNVAWGIRISSCLLWNVR